MTNLTDQRPRPRLTRDAGPPDPATTGGADVERDVLERAIVDCDPALRRGCCAMFSLTSTARDRVVVVHEVESPQLEEAAATRIADAIRQSLLAEHGLKVDVVALLRPDSIPRTSSGAVDPVACQIRFLDGSLNAALCGTEEPAEADGHAQVTTSTALSTRSSTTATEPLPVATEAKAENSEPQAIDGSVGRRRYRWPALVRRRSDGVLVTDESPTRQILPYVMPRRSESLAFHESNYDLSKTLRWLRDYNQRAAEKATLFDLFLWAVARTAHERPEMNRFVSGRRLYQRNKVSISFAAKKELDLAAAVVNIKLDFPADEPFAACVHRIATTIDERRTGLPSAEEREVDVLMRLPRFLTRAALIGYRFLDRINCLPRGYIEADPLFTSAFVANLGSLGLDSAYHHLYEIGTCSLFAVLGAPKKMLFVGIDGKPEVRDGLEVRWTADTRIVDGHYNAVCLRRVQAIVEDPAQCLDAD